MQTQILTIVNMLILFAGGVPDNVNEIHINRHSYFKYNWFQRFVAFNMLDNVYMFLLM